MVNSVPPLVWFTPDLPGRDRLNRAAIVTAAVTVADAQGADGLTMTAVARELGDYTPMALYRYVGSKDGLIDLMLDDVLREVPLPSAGVAWRRALRELAMHTWAVARRHPWYPQLAPTRPPLGPNNLRRTEAVLTVLTHAGLDTGEALGHLALLDRHVHSTAVAAAEETAMFSRYGLDNDADVAALISALHETVVADGKYPLLARWMSSPQLLGWDEQLELALDFLLDGIAGRIEATDG